MNHYFFILTHLGFLAVLSQNLSAKSASIETRLPDKKIDQLSDQEEFNKFVKNFTPLTNEERKKMRDEVEIYNKLGMSCDDLDCFANCMKGQNFENCCNNQVCIGNCDFNQCVGNPSGAFEATFAWCKAYCAF